jgi:hypothetical protein
MTYIEALEEIKQIHPKKMMLSKKEVAELTNRSLSALDRDIRDGTGISYKKIRGRILYSIIDTAKWMSDLIQTA